MRERVIAFIIVGVSTVMTVSNAAGDAAIAQFVFGSKPWRRVGSRFRFAHRASSTAIASSRRRSPIGSMMSGRRGCTLAEAAGLRRHDDADFRLQDAAQRWASAAVPSPRAVSAISQTLPRQGAVGLRAQDLRMNPRRDRSPPLPTRAVVADPSDGSQRSLARAAQPGPLATLSSQPIGVSVSVPAAPQP